MTTLLKKLKINEVSLVSRPAINKRFVLYKSEDGQPEVENMVENIIETPVVETPVAKEELVAEPPKVEEPVVEKAASPKCPECGEEMEDDACKACGDKKKVKKDMEDLQKQVETERVEKEALTKELAELRELKSQIEKQAAVEKDMAVRKDFIQKASVDMQFIPGVNAEGMGIVLKEAAEKLDSETYSVLYRALQGASSVLGKNNVLTKELGSSLDTVTGETPYLQLDAIAKSMVMKSGEKITYADAFVKACQDNPAIYKQHVTEQHRR